MSSLRDIGKNTRSAIAMTRSDKPKPLGSVLDALVDRLGIRGRISEAEIVETWAILAGTKINAVTDSAWLEGDRLHVKVSSAAWRQQLHMNRTSWRERLNQELGREAIKEIVFR